MFGIKRRRDVAVQAEPGIVNLSAEDYELLLGIYKQQLDTREDIMALSKEVQKLIDKSREESDILKSMQTSMKALLQQNADLQSKIDQVPVAPEPAMSQEDKDALSELASDMDTAILSARQAIPQNTPQDNAGSGGGNTGVASTSQGGSAGLSDQAQSGGSSPGMSSNEPGQLGISNPSDTTNPSPGSQPSDTQPPVDGTATQADNRGDANPSGAPQPQEDAAKAASAHQNDADATQQAKPLAGTGGQ